MKTIEEEFEQWKFSRENEAERLGRKLAQVEKWQKRHAILTSQPYTNLIEARMLRLKELMAERHVTFVPQTDPYSRRHAAVYEKEQVRMELLGSFAISSQGVVSMDFYCSKRGVYPLRISVGKIERVTDRILVTLLGNHPKPW